MIVCWRFLLFIHLLVNLIEKDIHIKYTFSQLWNFRLASLTLSGPKSLHCQFELLNIFKNKNNEHPFWSSNFCVIPTILWNTFQWNKIYKLSFYNLTWMQSLWSNLTWLILAYFVLQFPHLEIRGNLECGSAQPSLFFLLLFSVIIVPTLILAVGLATIQTYSNLTLKQKLKNRWEMQTCFYDLQNIQSVKHLK